VDSGTFQSIPEEPTATSENPRDNLGDIPPATQNGKEIVTDELSRPDSPLVAIQATQFPTGRDVQLPGESLDDTAEKKLSGPNQNLLDGVPTGGKEDKVLDPDTPNRTRPGSQLQRKRKKRKSIVQGPKKRRKSSLTPTKPGPDSRSGEAENAQENVHLATPSPKRKRKKRKSIGQAAKKHKERRSSLQKNVRFSEMKDAEEEGQGIEEQEIEEERTEEEQALEEIEKEGEQGVGRQPPRQQRSDRSKEKPALPPSKTRRSSRNVLAVQSEVARNEERPPEPSRSKKTPSARAREQKKVKFSTARQEDQESAPKSQKKTVPVVVQRLTNLSALQDLSGSDDSSHEVDSADELSSRHKFPNRAGVNPADVLGQICRETLDKTISALDDGIAQESNPSRRAEWSRKRKAVEAFGAELDGRLLQIGEVLDGNFVLSTRLKREKKNMALLRSRLANLRKEREEIALRMDEVRRKYAAEEKANVVCSASQSPFFVPLLLILLAMTCLFSRIYKKTVNQIKQQEPMLREITQLTT
jgi:hypothetical protein